MCFVSLISALFMNWPFFAFAASVKPFVVQEQTSLNVEDGFCGGGDTLPEAYLGNATFSGICIGNTARLLGIPFAQNP
jgi:hypothetical protein